MVIHTRVYACTHKKRTISRVRNISCKEDYVIAFIELKLISEEVDVFYKRVQSPCELQQKAAQFFSHGLHSPDFRWHLDS